MLIIRTPGEGSHVTEHGMVNVSYSKYLSGMPVAKTPMPCLKTDGKEPDQPDYRKDTKKTTQCVLYSSIDMCWSFAETLLRLYWLMTLLKV